MQLKQNPSNTPGCGCAFWSYVFNYHSIDLSLEVIMLLSTLFRKYQTVCKFLFLLSDTYKCYTINFNSFLLFLYDAFLLKYQLSFSFEQFSFCQVKFPKQISITKIMIMKNMKKYGRINRCQTGNVPKWPMDELVLWPKRLKSNLGRDNVII